MKDTQNTPSALRNRVHRIFSALLLAALAALPLAGCGRSGNAPDPEAQTGPGHPAERKPPREVPTPEPEAPSEAAQETPPPGN